MSKTRHRRQYRQRKKKQKFNNLITSWLKENINDWFKAVIAWHQEHALKAMPLTHEFPSGGRKMDGPAITGEKSVYIVQDIKGLDS